MDAMDVQKFIQASQAGKLSTRDRKFVNNFQLSEDDMIANMRAEISPSNVASINAELNTAKDPEIKRILQQEKNSILQLIEEADRIKKEQQVQNAPPKEPSFFENILSTIQNLWSSK
jgi:ribosomal protein L24